MFSIAVVQLLFVGASSVAVQLTSDMKVFGHAIKNGHFAPKGTEITTFEHNCTSSPCALTQMHVPTAGPEGWEDARLRIYVDGEAVASIDITLLELANIGVYNGQDGDATPWGVDLFGHTANKGGVYSTMRVPFGASVRTTIESNEEDRSGTFWFIVRGLEAYPTVLGDLALPAAARLQLYRFDAPTVPNELVTLASVPRGVGGAVLNVKFDAAGHGAQANMGYLEACMRASFDGAAEPTFLSSGAEDYFLSAYYFNEGTFKTPQSGLTFKSGGSVSAYKVHNRDPVLFNDGVSGAALVRTPSEPPDTCLAPPLLAACADIQKWRGDRWLWQHGEGTEPVVPAQRVCFALLFSRRHVEHVGVCAWCAGRHLRSSVRHDGAVLFARHFRRCGRYECRQRHCHDGAPGHLELPQEQQPRTRAEVVGIRSAELRERR